MKRLFDVTAAACGLVVLAVPILLSAMAVIIEDGRPAFFRQVRVGRNERPFTLWKLRSMRKGTDNVATHLAAQQSVTRVGRFLRASKLDELPQLWNVLKGEMSLVGPRPCLPSQTEVIEARRQRGVLRFRPGITGLSQVAGHDFSTPEATAACDEEYTRRASLRLDLSLIAQTVTRRVLRLAGASHRVGTTGHGSVPSAPD